MQKIYRGITMIRSVFQDDGETYNTVRLDFYTDEHKQLQRNVK